MAKKRKYKDTSEIEIPDNIIEQVIGQKKAVDIMKKAASQRRHVLLIGEPGTGKSMLGVGLAELLPKEKLKDVLAFPNPNDENKPMIRAVPAGQGREIVSKAKVQNLGGLGNQSIIVMILVIASMIIPYWMWRANVFNLGEVANAIIYASSMITFIVVAAAFMFSMSLGKRMGQRKQVSEPKIIVDNYNQENAPFLDATGAHAGALLGDVMHDPFQCYSPVVNLCGVRGRTLNIQKEIDSIFEEYNEKVLSRKKRNYEAIFLPENEFHVLGFVDNSFTPVEVLSSNRHDHEGEMIKITTSQKKELFVTPEHKIGVKSGTKTHYVEAFKLAEGDQVICVNNDIIIDEQDIIDTYDSRQREQCKLYQRYLDIRSKNPDWGYKKIAKTMGQKPGKTRWWHAGKHKPVPIQTTEWLRQRGLLPLNRDNENLALIAKILGVTFGDGGIFNNLNGIFFSSSEKEAAEKFRRDLEQLFSLERDENSRLIKSGEYGVSWCCQNTNRNIIRFFIALGAPIGKKSRIPLNVPDWIGIDEAIEDEFFGSIFGNEVGISKHYSAGARIEFGITGLETLADNRRSFLKEIINYLKSKRINTGSIYVYDRKNQRNSQVFRFCLELNLDSAINFYERVKLNYCNYKKDNLKKYVNQLIRLRYEEYYGLLKEGFSAEEIMEKLELRPRDLYHVLDSSEMIIHESQQVYA